MNFSLDRNASISVMMKKVTCFQWSQTQHNVCPCWWQSHKSHSLFRVLVIVALSSHFVEARSMIPVCFMISLWILFWKQDILLLMPRSLENVKTAFSFSPFPRLACYSTSHTMKGVDTSNCGAASFLLLTPLHFIA